jgi:release factor glutamine methyltransferase
MLHPGASLYQIRSFLENELRKLYTSGEAASITRLVLEHAGYPYSTLLMKQSDRPGAATVTQIKEIVGELYTGKPIQYILGYTYFFDLKICVDQNVLIPRPETEEMVHRITANRRDAPSRIMDLGTGSGCIALAMKKCYPEAYVAGVDNSDAALKVARKNSVINDLQVDWINSDLIHGPAGELPREVDLMVSNPPYVREVERYHMHANVLDFEPPEALFVTDREPFVYFRAIASLGKESLKKQGQVWVEINENLAQETARIFENAGYSGVTVMKDIHEKERYIRASR